MSNAFAPILRARPCPIFGRPVHPGSPPIDYSPILLLKPFGFRITPDTLSSSEISRWPARHYPRLWIQRPSSGRRRDFNPPDSCAAQRTVQVGPPQTLASVLWPRGFGRFGFSLGIQGLDPAVPYESLHPIHAPSTPVAARPVIRSPTGLSQKIGPPLVLATSNQLSTLHRGFILIRLSDTHLPEFFFGLFIQRSRPHLLNAAAWTGLGPAPE